MANATKVQIIGEDGNAAKVNSAGALEVDATLTPSGTQDVNLTQVAGAAVTAGAGAVAAGTQRTTLASNDPAVVALQIIDDWDETDRAKVNPIVGQAGVAAGAGAVDALTQRQTLASNDPAVVALQLLDNAVGTVAAGAPATAALLGGTVYNATAPAPTDGQGMALQAGIDGSLLTNQRKVATAAITSVNSLATNQTLLALNTARRGVIIINTDANALYIKYGATATVSGGGYTAIVPTGGMWEMPQPIYTGILDGIWAADGAGLAEITEL